MVLAFISKGWVDFAEAGQKPIDIDKLAAIRLAWKKDFEILVLYWFCFSFGRLYHFFEYCLYMQSNNLFEVLFLGDVVGRPGRLHVKKYLSEITSEDKPDLVIVNAENAPMVLGSQKKL